MAQNGVTIFDGTKLVGAMVKAPDGVELGRIFDLVITSHRNGDFAIVSQAFPPEVADDDKYYVYLFVVEQVVG